MDTGDEPLLVAATLGNLNWSTERFTRDRVLTDRMFVQYTCFDGARGDVGLVAEVDGRAVGAAWALLLPAPGGYGHVDDATPEASMWVAADHRGRGIGRELTERLLAMAADAGHARLSLSVESGNTRARSLYSSVGFVAVPGREADGVMVVDLAALR